MLHSTTETGPSHTRDADPAADPELRRLRDEVIRVYGSRLDRLRTVDPEQVPSILEAAGRVVAAVETAIAQSQTGGGPA